MNTTPSTDRQDMTTDKREQTFGGRTLEEWRVHARRDDCLERMVPSDLREILMQIPASPLAPEEWQDKGDRELRSLIVQRIKEKTAGGESAEMCARWIMADIERLSALSKARSAGPSKDEREWDEMVEVIADLRKHLAVMLVAYGSENMPDRIRAINRAEAVLFKHSPKAGQEEPRRGRCEYPNCGGECAECQP